MGAGFHPARRPFLPYCFWTSVVRLAMLSALGLADNGAGVLLDPGFLLPGVMPGVEFDLLDCARECCCAFDHGEQLAIAYGA